MRDLPLALDLRRRLLHDVEHARDLPVIAWNGTIGKREVRFLRHRAALDEELKILRPGGGPAVLDAPGHWPSDVPDFGPDSAAGAASDCGCLSLRIGL